MKETHGKADQSMTFVRPLITTFAMTAITRCHAMKPATAKIKSPDENRIKELYGDDREGAKRYRRGWDNAGKIIQANRLQKKKK